MNHQYPKLFRQCTTAQHKNRPSSNVKKSIISEATVLSWKLDCSVTVPDLFVFEVEKKFCWAKVSTLKGATWLLWVNDNLESHYCWSFIIHEQKHYYGSKVHRRHDGHHHHHHHHHHHDREQGGETARQCKHGPPQLWMASNVPSAASQRLSPLALRLPCTTCTCTATLVNTQTPAWKFLVQLALGLPCTTCTASCTMCTVCCTKCRAEPSPCIFSLPLSRCSRHKH